jgi:hypothetical protein
MAFGDLKPITGHRQHTEKGMIWLSEQRGNCKEENWIVFVAGHSRSCVCCHFRYSRHFLGLELVFNGRRLRQLSLPELLQRDT